MNWKLFVFLKICYLGGARKKYISDCDQIHGSGSYLVGDEP